MLLVSTLVEKSHNFVIIVRAQLNYCILINYYSITDVYTDSIINEKLTWMLNHKS